MTDKQETNLAPPDFNFTFDESVAEWNVNHREWLKTHDKTWDSLATGALVFDTSNRILLLQRAPDDSMPNRWEIPGGACDDEDETVLYGCARELWEEAGLRLRHIRRVIPDGANGKPGAVFTNRTGKRFFCKFSFEVDVEDTAEVKLDPKEHQDYVWATEEEVKGQRMREREIPLTNGLMVRLIEKGFAKRRDDKGA
ncbi:NUDIX hydrolase domain-like protein [Fusarium redolens]|jgi:8-oxo-dGTP pyrophosphatase MutT (NUDIX family)|uniref:NUDIX hydrolase domain-like protein n=1 Tax=Fusarium redolens TaxID=48865 RepID=A0A9P9GQV6_FUSRE|nr:NUDIX hydrolase domain-like protein [Fusarium redolens]KAH7244054.1 NUDIX hydrolase domain-like protein [Fusarium redolens]